MYTPKHTAETDVDTLRQFVRENPLCALVTQTAAGLVATHLPLILHTEGEGFGVLRGHMARANLHWRDSLQGVQALGIFTGPEHYISAAWYPGKQVHHKDVPTWNYTAVHVYGALRVIEDADWLLAHLRALTDRHEASVGMSWSVDDAAPGFIEHLTRAIVGVELDAVGTPASAAMGELVRSRRPR
ncbi:FMN-binding negative transcriptional regulator [Granulicella rosea]|nr:FMN-binding negative transcriptional regulator [Granulicella rosea]